MTVQGYRGGPSPPNPHPNFALNTGQFKMNQICKVCGEPAAGFHFGAFTCEGCKSFFGRSYNNVNQMNDCKNNNKCVINKKNRTACKACRLRKCLLVGMSKSGSRYGRRSNWFKIHCLLQEQQQRDLQENGEAPNGQERMAAQITPPPNPHQQMGMRMLAANHFAPQLLHLPRTREEMLLLGLEESFRHSVSPTVSSPDSHNSDSSIEVADPRRLPLMPALLPPTFLPPPSPLFPAGYHPFYHGLLQSALPLHHNHQNNNNNIHQRNSNPVTDTKGKREFLDAILQRQRAATPSAGEDDTEDDEEIDVKTPVATPIPIQDTPIDLSMRTLSERGSSPARSERSGMSGMTSESARNASDCDEESDCDSENRGLGRIGLVRPTPLDLTTRV